VARHRPEAAVLVAGNLVPADRRLGAHPGEEIVGRAVDEPLGVHQVDGVERDFSDSVSGHRVGEDMTTSPHTTTGQTGWKNSTLRSGGARSAARARGGGAGGLWAAARLSHHGYRTLLVEGRDRVGGRASSVDEEGFTVNTGAIAIEYGGVLEETFRTVGAPFEIRVPQPATMFRLKRRDVDISKGGWGKLIGGITKKGAGLLSGMGRARHGDMPDEQLSVEAWLQGYTKNKTVHAIFRNLCAAIFAVNADEMPAKAFLTYFIQKGAFRDF